jgi:hypothetical protein
VTSLGDGSSGPIPVGFASGWSVGSTPDAQGMYQWSAWGPGGGNMSRAQTREDAEAKAKACMEALRRTPAQAPRLVIDHTEGRP